MTSVALIAAIALLSGSASANGEKKTVLVPMRDGVRLSTDLFHPDSPKGPKPVVLIRTPYGKSTYREMADYFSGRGYAVAVQDVRGRFPSEGAWEPGIHEGEDGYDAVEWLARQDWSNGKVGTIGASYDGWLQFLTALEKPPHLAAIIPNVPDAGPFHNFPYEYGVFFTYGALWWLDSFEGGMLGRSRDWLNRLNTLPVIDLMPRITGKDSAVFRQWIQHNTSDAYWAKADYLDRLSALKIPVLLQGGWFDTATNGLKLAYQKLREAGNINLKLIVGPWIHSAKSSRRLGDADFGPAAEFDLFDLYGRWFDHWLKGFENGILKEPRVQLFLIGPNRWLEGDAYPLPKTVFTEFYLASDRGAETLKGDGRLQPGEPASGKEFDAYAYDPGDPTPGLTTRFRQGGMKGYLEITGARKDLLIYESVPLAGPMNIVGPISLKLFASTSAKDTDWVATLASVDDNGVPEPLGRGFGMLRARFRNSVHRPELLDKDRIYEYTIDLWQAGTQIPKGRRIRLEISSAYSPTYSRNLNTGQSNETDADFVTANQKIFHSAAYPSRLILPVVDPAGLK
jgi:putative CocE/NonD family hydrolase